MTIERLWREPTAMNNGAPNSDVLAGLAATIAARRAGGSAGSYTVRLLEKGVEKCAQKLGEEAVETVIAAVNGDRDAVITETADLLYHLLVTLEACDVSLNDVLSELGRREGIGGLAEKASRTSE